MLTEASILSDFSRVLGGPVTNPKKLAQNAYCHIYQVDFAGRPIIAKKYISGDLKLPVHEAAGVSRYHAAVDGDSRYIDGDTVAISEAERVVAMTFVEGERLADVLRRSASATTSWEPCFKAMHLLGELLRKFRSASLATDAPCTPFHFEYLRYTSRRLSELPVLGRLHFSRAIEEAEALISDVSSAPFPVSFAHGDFVFRNIHFADGRIGLIDFANAQEHSHPANDMLNLWFALRTMRLPVEFRGGLWRRFLEGYGGIDFLEVAERFFFEYHRRRWLMLNVRTRDPRRLLRGLLAARTFARPYDTRDSRILA